jgi:hypothetical protein
VPTYIQTTARADKLNGRLARANLHDVYAHSLIGSVQDPFVSTSIFCFCPHPLSSSILILARFTPVFLCLYPLLRAIYSGGLLLAWSFRLSFLRMQTTSTQTTSTQTSLYADKHLQTQTPAPTPMPFSSTHLLIRSLRLTAPWCARSQAFKGYTFKLLLPPVST